MKSHWKIVQRELRDLLREPRSRLSYARLRQARPALHRWPQAQLVSSFLVRRTAPLELRKAVAKLLVAAAREEGCEVAWTILVLAGALLASRMGGKGKPPVTSALVVVLGCLESKTAEAPAAPFLISMPTVQGAEGRLLGALA
jgi:hypothetical protein